jgi:hypothetical protein
MWIVDEASSRCKIALLAAIDAPAIISAPVAHAKT